MWDRYQQEISRWVRSVVVSRHEMQRESHHCEWHHIKLKTKTRWSLLLIREGKKRRGKKAFGISIFPSSFSFFLFDSRVHSKSFAIHDTKWVMNHFWKKFSLDAWKLHYSEILIQWTLLDDFFFVASIFKHQQNFLYFYFSFTVKRTHQTDFYFYDTFTRISNFFFSSTG